MKVGVLVTWLIVLVTLRPGAAMDWPDVQSVASWPSIHDERDRQPASFANPGVNWPRRGVHQPSLVELQRLRAGSRTTVPIRPSTRCVLPGRAALSGVVFFSIIGLSFAALLGYTLWRHPLFPLKPDSVAWCRSWLITTVADYYGAALALSGVIVASEPPWQAALWVGGCCLLGTPACCAYVVTRLFRHGTLRLVR